MDHIGVYCAIAFFSSREPGMPLRLIQAYRTTCLDVAKTLAAMGADYIRVYDNCAAYASEQATHTGFTWTYNRFMWT